MDFQPDMGVGGLVVHGEGVGGVALERGHLDQRRPKHFRKLAGRRVALYPRGRKAAMGWIIAFEERRVDHDLAHDAGCSEPDDDPVAARLATAAGLPAVVDLSIVVEGLR